MAQSEKIIERALFQGDNVENDWWKKPRISSNDMTYKVLPKCFLISFRFGLIFVFDQTEIWEGMYDLW